MSEGHSRIYSRPSSLHPGSMLIMFEEGDEVPRRSELGTVSPAKRTYVPPHLKELVELYQERGNIKELPDDVVRLLSSVVQGTLDVNLL